MVVIRLVMVVFDNQQLFCAKSMLVHTPPMAIGARSHTDFVGDLRCTSTMGFLRISYEIHSLTTNSLYPPKAMTINHFRIINS